MKDTVAARGWMALRRSELAREIGSAALVADGYHARPSALAALAHCATFW